MTSLTQRLRRRMDGLAQTAFRSTVQSVLAPAIFLATCANGFASSDAPSGPLNPTQHEISSDALMHQNTIEPTIASPALDAQQGASNAQAQQEAISEGVSLSVETSLEFMCNNIFLSLKSTYPGIFQETPTLPPEYNMCDFTVTPADYVENAFRQGMDSMYSTLEVGRDKQEGILGGMMTLLSDLNVTRRELHKISNKLEEAAERQQEYHGEEYSSVPLLTAILSQDYSAAKENIRTIRHALPIWQHKLACECFNFAKKYDLKCGALPISIILERKGTIKDEQADELAECFLNFYDAYSGKSYDSSDPMMEVASIAGEIGNKSAKIFMDSLIWECNARDRDALRPFYDRLGSITKKIKMIMYWTNNYSGVMSKFLQMCEGLRIENALDHTLKLACAPVEGREDAFALVAAENVDSRFRGITHNVHEYVNGEGRMAVKTLADMLTTLRDFAAAGGELYQIRDKLANGKKSLADDYPTVSLLTDILSQEGDAPLKSVQELIEVWPIWQYNLACECLKFAKGYNLRCDASPISILLNNRREPITQDQAQELAGCFLDFYDASEMGSELMTNLATTVGSIDNDSTHRFLNALLQECKIRDQNNISAINNRFRTLEGKLKSVPDVDQ